MQTQQKPGGARGQTGAEGLLSLLKVPPDGEVGPKLATKLALLAPRGPCQVAKCLSISISVPERRPAPGPSGWSPLFLP